ncbi:MAG TPA: hypothetical protein VGB87_17490 [Vicinamibacteria bacterium]
MSSRVPPRVKRGRRSLAPLVVAGLPFLAGGCAAGAPDVLGRSVTLVPKVQEAGAVKGELLAADRDRIWVRTKDGVRDVDPATLREVRVRRHGLTGSWARGWGLAGGLVSGIALTAACASVEGNGAGGCAGVGGVVGGLWVAVGLASSPGLESSSRLRLDPGASDLKSYARFPSGLPAGVTPAELSTGPPAPR